MLLQLLAQPSGHVLDQLPARNQATAVNHNNALKSLETMSYERLEHNNVYY